MNPADNYTTACACSNALCLQWGCQEMKHSGYPGAGTYTLYTNPPPRGCICPPGANKECENQYCPRKPYPVSAHIEVKK